MTLERLLHLKSVVAHSLTVNVDKVGECVQEIERLQADLVDAKHEIHSACQALQDEQNDCDRLEKELEQAKERERQLRLESELAVVLLSKNDLKIRDLESANARLREALTLIADRSQEFNWWEYVGIAEAALTVPPAKEKP